MALGNIERGKKKFAECGDTYTLGIDALPSVSDQNWVFFYFRGICYERSKQWPKSEADLKKALELKPEQPHVLNYLGYSWIDQNRNLKQGMALIEKAVALKPDDGYIVDSLGWAHYRLGNYNEAVRYLERAVELRPEDPILNDHLGDALWRVGRQREAHYQWQHALALKPEPEEFDKITKKLQTGIPEDSILRETRKAQKKGKSTSSVEQQKTPGETNLAPVAPAP
jgi:Flp pilus assembly protein TadD